MDAGPADSLAAVRAGGGRLMGDRDWETAKKVEQLKRETGQRQLAETKPEALPSSVRPRTKDNGRGNWRN